MMQAWRIMATVLYLSGGLHASTGAKVLGIAFIGGVSHQMNIMKIGETLAQRGHSFTLLMSAADQLSLQRLRPRQTERVKILEYPGAVNFRPFQKFDDAELHASRDPTKSVIKWMADARNSAHALMGDNATMQDLLHAGYDVVVRDAWYWPAAVLTAKLGLPAVDVMPTSFVQPNAQLYLQAPNPLAYVPQLEGTEVKGMWGRMQNLFQAMLYTHLAFEPQQRDMRHFSEQQGLHPPELRRGHSAAVATILVTDWAHEPPQPMPPHIHMVGAILYEPPAALPADLQDFMDQCNGVIYVSMGTMAVLTTPELLSLSGAFASLHECVIWKLKDFPVNVTKADLNLTANVKTMDWAPQADILGHPNIRAFVTQGGINSMYEAMHNAVPMAVVPQVGDQVYNLARAEHHGYAVGILPPKLTPANPEYVHLQLRRLLDDPKNKDAALQAQRRAWRPRSSAEMAADVVDKVIDTGGEPYLITKERDLAWWQLALLDVYLLVATALAAALGLLVGLTYLVVRQLQQALRGGSSRSAKAKRA